MSTIVMIIHVVVSVFLIVVVLLQSGKGADIGAAFGSGASQTLFGARRGDALSKITTGAAITFMITTLVLTYYSTTRGSAAREFGAVAPAAAPAATVPAAPQEQAAPAAAAPEAEKKAAPAQPAAQEKEKGGKK